MALSCSATNLLASAKRYGSLSERELQVAKLNFWCQGVTGFGAPAVPTGFSWQSGGQIAASWNVPAPGTTLTEVWTSSDGVSYALNSQVAAPGTTKNVSRPGIGSFKFGKIRAYNGHTYSPFTAAIISSGRVCDWVGRVGVNGGAAPSAATRTALDNFDYSLNQNSVDTLMQSLSMFVPDNLIACLTPLYNTFGSDPWTNNGGNFVVGDLTVNGLKGDGSTKLLLTGCVPTTIWTNAGGNFSAGTTLGLSVYSQTLGSGTAAMDMGSASNIGATQFSLAAEFQPGSANLTVFACTNNSNGQIAVANAGWIGFTSGNQTAPTAGAIYTASSTKAFGSIGTNANNQSGNAFPLQQLAVFGFLSNTSVAVPNSDRRLSFAAIHLGLTSAQCQALYNAVQACRTSLGGGYV